MLGCCEQCDMSTYAGSNASPACGRHHHPVVDASRDQQPTFFGLSLQLVAYWSLTADVQGAATDNGSYLP